MVKRRLVSLVVAMLAITPCSAQTLSTHLPAALTPSTMKISFELDTTWHTVHGTAKDLIGKVWFKNPKDPGSIRASLSIPVSSLDTASESRDEEMRDSMDANQFSSIQVEMPRISPSCDVRTLVVGSACAYATNGTIRIRDVTLPIALSGDVHRDRSGALVVAGSAQLDWSKFGVKDPSILIARVSEQVKIIFTINLPEKRDKE